MEIKKTHCYDLMDVFIQSIGDSSMKKLHYLAGGIFARLAFLGRNYDVTIRPSEGVK